MAEPQARVGVGILILKDGKVLLGKRKGAHGAGEYASAGGHLEYGETAEEAVLRELDEECGIKVKNLRFLCVSDLMTYWPKHYIDVGFVADWEFGEPEVREPHKLESWGWYDLDNLPEGKFFGVMPGYFEAYKTGKTYFTYQKAQA